MENWDDIKKKVEDNGNVSTITMGVLRDAAGKDKLGVHVRSEIARTLDGLGLGYVPVELPTYQDESVRLYKRGTPIGEVIETVLNPGKANDTKLKEHFADDTVDYAQIIEQIRELVAE